MMDGRLPLSFGAPPSSSSATSASLSGGYISSLSAASPSAKSMPRTSTSVTRPCPTSAQGEQATKIRKLRDVMNDVFPMKPTLLPAACIVCVHRFHSKPARKHVKQLITEWAENIPCRIGTCGT